MYEISGFFLFEALRNSLGLKRFEGRGFNTSGRYEKSEKCWITDERLWITIQPFYGRWKLPIFAKLFIKQFFTSFWFCIKTSQLVYSYKATCFEFDLHKNENDTIANTIFFYIETSFDTEELIKQFRNDLFQFLSILEADFMLRRYIY